MQPVKGPQQGFPQQGPPPQGFPQQGFPQQGPPQQQGQPQQIQARPPQPVIYAQPTPGMPQPVFVQQPMQVQHAKYLSGFDRINKDGLFIKQKVDIVEIASGCERENSYSVFNLDKANEKTGVELLRVREKSNFCARQLLSGGCRPFMATIQLRDNDPKVHNQAFLELERPCTCTFWCFARPVINVHHVEGGQRTYLGQLKNPCQCNCNLNLEVYDNRNMLQYKIRGTCCQTGVLCGQCDCQSCQTVDLAISTPNGNDVSSIQKKSAGYCASKMSLADNWALLFPNNSTVETKALLLSATIFLDYLFFEKGGVGTMR